MKTPCTAQRAPRLPSKCPYYEACKISSLDNKREGYQDVIPSMQVVLDLVTLESTGIPDKVWGVSGNPTRIPVSQKNMMSNHDSLPSKHCLNINSAHMSQWQCWVTVHKESRGFKGSSWGFLGNLCNHMILWFTKKLLPWGNHFWKEWCRLEWSYYSEILSSSAQHGLILSKVV
jgi:hypothetical protein